MGETTAISWADHTHNHWLGCAKISNGPQGACEGCYAKVLTEDRFGRVTFGGPGLGLGTRVLTSEQNRRRPFHWNRVAGHRRTHPFVFCNSLSDVFDNAVPRDWRMGLFLTIQATPHLTWLLLTKRPGNIRHLSEDLCGLPRNAAIGATVVTQDEAERDVPKLLAAATVLKPAFTFLSLEPLLGPVNLRALNVGESVKLDALTGHHTGSAIFAGGLDRAQDALPHLTALPAILPPIDWVIAGGETDQGAHKARPSELAWFQSLRDQCAEAFVPFHFKQWGEWAPGECADRVQTRSKTGAWWAGDGWIFQTFTPAASRNMHADDEPDVWRLGKARTGRKLDGVIHDARPEVAA